MSSTIKMVLEFPMNIAQKVFNREFHMRDYITPVVEEELWCQRIAETMKSLPDVSGFNEKMYQDLEKTHMKDDSEMMVRLAKKEEAAVQERAVWKANQDVKYKELFDMTYDDYMKLTHDEKEKVKADRHVVWNGWDWIRKVEE